MDSTRPSKALRHITPRCELDSPNTATRPAPDEMRGSQMNKKFLSTVLSCVIAIGVVVVKIGIKYAASHPTGAFPSLITPEKTEFTSA